MPTIAGRVTSQQLCIGCGLCSFVCPSHAITMHWTQHQTWEPQLNYSRCVRCNSCLQVCPNSPECISEYATKAIEAGERFGLSSAMTCYIAYDLESEKRIRSASGGALTSLVQYLFDSSEIKGAIIAVPTVNPVGELHYYLKIARSGEELEQGRSSCYYPLNYERILKEISASQEQYVLIGVPCIMRGIKRLPKTVQQQFRYLFSLVCSHNVTGTFLDCLAQQEGIPQDEPFVANLRDKFGQIPDANNYNTYLQTPRQEIRCNRFNNAYTDMWRNYFFAQEACLYCPDFYGVDADLSVKDAWGRLSRDPLGMSLLIVRNPDLLPILRQLREERELFLEECDADEIFYSQSVTAHFKHVEVRDRIVWKSVIQKELEKNHCPLGTSRCLWKKASWKYWQFFSFMKLSKFLYARWGYKAVNALLTGNRSISPEIYIMKLSLSFIRKQFSRFKKICSPLLYLLRGLFRHPITPIPNTLKKQTFEVLIVGGYGYQNTGDEAQLAAVISHWKRLCPDAQLTILSPNPQYTENMHGEQAELAPRVTLFNANTSPDYGMSNFWYKWRFFWIGIHLLILAACYKKQIPLPGAYPHESHLLHLLTKSDVIHLSGGGYLTGMTLSRLWENMLLIRIADMLGTPTILSGQTIGVFKDSISKWLARWGLKKAKYIYLRDPKGSLQDVHSLGIIGTHIKATFDDALFCDVAEDTTILECLHQNNISEYQQYIAVNVHYFQQHPTESRRIMKRMAEVCDYIVSHHQMLIVFIPLQPSDIPSMKEVQQLMSQESSIIDYDFDYQVAKGVIGKANMLLTMKHHGIIFAMAQAIPTIAIALDDYYVRKNEGALRLFRQESWIINRERIFRSNFFEKMIDKCFDTIERQKTIIASQLIKMKEQDGEAIRQFLQHDRNGFHNGP